MIPELTRLTDRALAGPLPEELAQSVIEHHVLERIVGELAASGELDRLVASALGSPRTMELTDRIVRSDEFRGALRQIVASPELRAALTEQTAGIFDELIAELRRGAVGMDDRVEHAIRRPRLCRHRQPLGRLRSRPVSDRRHLHRPLGLRSVDHFAGRDAATDLAR